MGGHGGLNILPQKKWNVYNWDNRIKVEQNEKLVAEEIKRRNKVKTEKRLIDKVNSIKTNTKFTESKILSNGDNNILNDRISNEDDYRKEKNQIYKEIMERRNMEKRLNVDLQLEKLNEPMKQKQNLQLFDDEKKMNKYIEEEGKLEKERGTTFKDSLKNIELKPWYVKKKKDDFKEYKQYKQYKEYTQDNNNLVNKVKEEEDRNTLLNKKRNKKSTKDKVKSKGEEYKQFMKQLKREREIIDEMNRLKSLNNLNYKK